MSQSSAAHSDDNTPTVDALGAHTGSYVVVARRYRPQSFDELVGQEHVARALTNAISTSRVGHAYLFTGARGVGKTSAARILAKALNCVHGPTPTPCNQCDICLSIAAGSDVDVLEIDGASNRGIDEIRQLRQNVSIRPSRARFKIYIIDEVHMLTREAFNALLKTLEEPPEHVKFIFCTTEATKIPITILSRCQRFDFAGIQLSSIVERLRQIVEAEGVSVEPEALAILARRAAGSMRDSQSLLEQLLAFGGERITATDVHAMLGTAGESRLAELAGHLVEHNSAAAIELLDAALAEGVDVGQLLEQLLGYYRDALAAAVGCPGEAFLNTSSAERARVTDVGKLLGVQTILAILQIIDHTLARLRYSTQGRTLAEMALVRIAELENLDELAKLLTRMQRESPRGGASPPVPRSTLSPADASAKKKGTLSAPRHAPAETSAAPPQPAPQQAVALTADSAGTLWRQALAGMDGLLPDFAGACSSIAPGGPDRVVVTFGEPYTSGKAAKAFCERPEHRTKLEAALSEVAGRPLSVEFVLADEGSTQRPPQPATPKRATAAQRQRQAAEHPLVRRAGELFDARVVRVEAGNDPPDP